MTQVSPIARAEHEQRQASDPAISAFVSAHAGAGKTKLLVDRLLRLMLAGADPARILCLTYTKAAAAEMAIRLQQRLGRFVTLDDAALDASLAALQVAGTPAGRALARALFARVLDLPGGMRIGTIHAFCQSLLRRFPLEARISPHFALVDDADARVALQQAREAALPEADPAALATLAGLLNADHFAVMIGQLEEQRDRLSAALALTPGALNAALRRTAGVTAADEASLIAQAVSWPGESRLREALTRARNHGSRDVADRAENLLGWLNKPVQDRAKLWHEWVEHLFNKDGKPTALKYYCNDKLARIHPDIADICAEEQARMEAVHEQLRALRLVEATAALLRLAAPILQGFAAEKSGTGKLDYHDLIRLTADLLREPDVAAWVLFKLDGGLDHLLLDEVQDTAPAQWQIAADLTGDFFSGAGVREPGSRTVFAVGDVKQSIYSFQGALPAAFDEWRDRYRERVEGAGQTWRQTELDVSFRSTTPVLALVDAVFADPQAASGVCTPGTLKHIPNRVGQAGAVTLWPLAPRPATQPADIWAIAQRNQTQESAPDRLVKQLSQWIATQLRSGTMLKSAGRALRPGDILVLVRRRNNFGRALVRALKSAGVPVAGLDRMMLTDQPAVQDLMALCDALLLPQDDLTFCEFLVSPLGGVSDDSLMQLVAQRSGSVWDELRTKGSMREDWRAALDLFSTLLARVDYAAPHALLSEVLGEKGGRARLFARLGPEAAEPVDELLNAALRYGAAHPPSLQGFLHWLRQSGAEVKREAEAAGDVVRIMTVHGAKGLEAPLVILPDTVGVPPDGKKWHWARDAATGVELPLWAPNRTLRCAAFDRLHRAAAASTAEEYNRLLYVALTRARDQLLVCGWQLSGKIPETSWYALVQRGLARLDPERSDMQDWGETLRVISLQTALPEKAVAAARPPGVALPAWAGCAPSWQPAPLPPEPRHPRPLAPSRPEGVAYGPVPAAGSPLGESAVSGKPERFRRGLTMHALLQHLPDVPAAERWRAAVCYAARQAAGDPQSVAAQTLAAETLATQALAVLDHPDLAALFGPGSRAEQPVAGVVGDLVVIGQVDRFRALPDRVLIADYKTNRVAPATADAVPVLYLRQMAAYRAVLGQLYPTLPVHCVLIWTEGPAIMRLPEDLLDRHAPGVKA